MDIDKILLKVLSNKASQEEFDALEAWKQDSADNLKALQEMMSSSNTASSYKDYNPEAAWDQIAPKVYQDSTPTAHKSSSLSKILIGLAACFLIAGIGYLLYNQDEKQTNYQANDAVENIQLADNSQVWLNKGGSTIDIISDFETERIVALEGEAFFDVAPNKEVPFIIKVKDKSFIKVIGTSFNVINTSKEFDLTVYSGVVEYHTLNRVIELVKDDRITFINGAYAKVKNDNYNKISWRNNELVFENTTIDNVFSVLEDHFDVAINFNRKSDLSKCRIRTKFVNESLDSILKELKQHFNFDYTNSKGIINISGIKCK